MTDELKPCPFCGKEAWLRKMPLGIDSSIVWYAVGCSDLGCIGFNAGREFFNSEEEAMAAWNRRPGCDGCRRNDDSFKFHMCGYCSRHWRYGDMYEPKDDDEQED